MPAPPDAAPPDAAPPENAVAARRRSAEAGAAGARRCRSAEAGITGVRRRRCECRQPAGLLRARGARNAGRGPPVRYLVQLPPEYDPYRRYPAIVTLHGAGTTAMQQIDWWAGDRAKAACAPGQATRHGYIVIAPDWTAEHQKQYGYSAREHAAVLDCLRDACRRFSIDTDRVFLSGHSMGGDAAWDIGLAHPDLWAGVIPIVAQADRYCALYWENAKLRAVLRRRRRVGRRRSMADNARDLDRYLTPRLQRHGGRVPRPRARALLRRDPADLRLDGPLPPRLLPAGVHLRDDAAVGQFLLVGRAGRACRRARWSIRPTGRRRDGTQAVQIKATITDQQRPQRAHGHAAR